jgi:hypothetical protein
MTRTVTDTKPITTAEECPDLDNMTRAVLLDFSETHGVLVETGWTKGEIIRQPRVFRRQRKFRQSRT